MNNLVTCEKTGDAEIIFVHVESEKFPQFESKDRSELLEFKKDYNIEL